EVFVELDRAERRGQASARLEAERTAAEEATRRSEFLAYASRELGASLNLDESMERFLQMLVPGLAQYALLSVNVEEDGLVMCCDGNPARLQVLAGVDDFPEVLRSAMREGRKTELGLRPAGLLPEHVRFVRYLQP